MRIEEELKLDYSDVLFRPKRSTLKSRKDVNLLRTYRFKYSKNEWSGIPIMAANMDGVGELGVAEKLNEYGMITSLTKQHDVKKLKQNKNIKKIYPNIALSVGIKKEDFEIDEKEWDESLVKSPFSTAFQMSNYYKPENVALGSKQIFIRVLDDSENIVGQFSGILNFKASGYISNPISKSIINRFHLGSNLVWKHGPIIHDLKNHEKISFLIFESINKLCKKYNIPTANFGVFKNISESNKFLESCNFPIVIFSPI